MYKIVFYYIKIISYLLNLFVIMIIRVYQKFISPFLIRKCCYYPSCSAYVIGSLKKYNFFKAIYFSLLRILKCSSLNLGGYDPF